MTSKPHKELAFIIDRALASPYGVPYDESHEAREALDSLVEQFDALQKERDALFNRRRLLLAENKELRRQIDTAREELTGVVLAPNPATKPEGT